MLYTLTIGLSALLLFLVQPLVSKMLLPVFGGGASVWIVSLVFFQTMLLIGYAGSHFVIRRFGLFKHMALLLSLFFISLFSLPLTTGQTQIFGPTVSVFVLLTTGIGCAYLVLASTSPTLQYWLARDLKHPQVNPYVQYGVSNAGSLIGLLAYPFLLEPLSGIKTQSTIWSAGFVVYGCLLLLTAYRFYARNGKILLVLDTIAPVVWRDRFKWIFLAFVPSAALLVTTHYLILDVVNFPLLWVLPLCVYLISFILCFLLPQLSLSGQGRTLLGILSILLFICLVSYGATLTLELRILLSLCSLFGICMIFHGDLERAKPDKGNLTDYYLQISLGGTSGSILVGLVAPILFQSTWEFYLVPLIALLYVVHAHVMIGDRIRLLFNSVIMIVVAYSWLLQETDFDGRTEYRARSFYSAYAIRHIEDTGVRKLVAGTHVHGEQYTLNEKSTTPLSYYSKYSGVAQLFLRLESKSTIGLIGVGVGSLTAYGRPQDQFDLFELDPLVLEIAVDEFSYLTETPSALRYITGDGRISLKQEPNGRYDLLVVDAFTSGSIPMHLVTVEAIDEMFLKMKPGGAVAYHISNQHVDLGPVLKGISSQLGLGIAVHQQTQGFNSETYPARWVVLAKDQQQIDLLKQSTLGWRDIEGASVVWTDDRSSIWTVLK
jgi:spermidine synthase